MLTGPVHNHARAAIDRLYQALDSANVACEDGSCLGILNALRRLEQEAFNLSWHLTGNSLLDELSAPSVVVTPNKADSINETNHA